jgi:hypothetical protein
MAHAEFRRQPFSRRTPRLVREIVRVKMRGVNPTEGFVGTWGELEIRHARSWEAKTADEMLRTSAL